MKLEDQVCSLEFAKNLKEFGVKQESLFYWVQRLPYPDAWEIWFSDDISELRGLSFFSAFTVSELGEMLNGYCLPYLIYHKPEYISGHWTGKYKERHWHMNYNNKEFDFGICSEADARAKMLIHLIEKGIVRIK